MIFYSMEDARDHYERLRLKNWRNYQESGLERYDDAQYRYEQIVMAFDAYLEAKDWRDKERTRRLKNADAYLENKMFSRHTSYTYEEVMDIVNGLKNVML